MFFHSFPLHVLQSMMSNESCLMLHTALSGSSTNQLKLDSTDPQDFFSYETVLGSFSSEKTTVGEKRKFPALSPAEINYSFLSAGQISRDLRIIIDTTGWPSSRAIEHYDTYMSFLPSRISAPEIVHTEFLSSEKYFTNARADHHRKRTVPTFEECNSSSMGFALGLMWDSNDLSPQWQPPQVRFHVVPSLRGGLDSESTAGSEPDPSLKQTPIIPADNSSMDLLAYVATDIIEVSPNLRPAFEVMDQFLKKQQQVLLYQQLSELESRCRQAVVLQLNSVLSPILLLGFIKLLWGKHVKLALPLIGLRRLLVRPGRSHTGCKAFTMILANHLLLAKRK